MDAKLPRGTRDLFPVEEFSRQCVIANCRQILKLCDAKMIDTPIFELRRALSTNNSVD